MGAKRTSVIWKNTDEEFKKVVSEAETISDVADFFNLKKKHGNYKTIHKRIKELNLSIDHFKKNYEITNERFNKMSKGKFDKEWLVKGVFRNGANLKRYLFRFNYFENKCEECGVGSIWCGKTLTLQVDHINGDNTDNRIQNLRILCPNCHTQTKNYAGRNRVIKHYCECGETKLKNSSCCLKCHHKNLKKRKVYRPDKHQLLQEIKETNFLQLSKKYGVSDNAIRKWCVSYGIPTKKKDYKNFTFS